MEPFKMDIETILKSNGFVEGEQRTDGLRIFTNEPGEEICKRCGQISEECNCPEYEEI